MTDGEIEAAILLADVVGSTALYQSQGNGPALRQISSRIDGLRAIVDAQGGWFVHSRGDDVLCLFENAQASFRAVKDMLAAPSNGVDIHIGLAFGPVIRSRNDVFGDAVNLAARLASRANPGEALVSSAIATCLPSSEQALLQLLGSMTVKGSGEPVVVHRLVMADADSTIHISTSPTLWSTATRARPEAAVDVSVHLRCLDAELVCAEGRSVSIGRDGRSSLVVDRPWVSRDHALLTNSDGKPRLLDRSSSGTYLVMGGMQEIFLHREETVLVGKGHLSLGMSTTEPGAVLVEFEVVRRDVLA